ncbi:MULTISPECIES: ATP phosphoribosyltransferase [Helicobacter]|uniref:ATP phosphoribosyltransferase n=1 Tax=Helicobacter macacae MIT 99-5501 TaxID=1357400 RepID=V8C712_9HELI|nr:MULTISPECIES: ATP phosphoribosyltransferase [Helicobacter]ETD22825.1 ATP phosphoribosyltransferase [Helicobacter macacae MIT 99-5501]RDU52666.1 ATP phosphoribosyltransferase [Helicobacter sp. MIT 01-3238]
MLNIALPKGRIAKETLQLFSRIFGEDFGFDDRKLILQKGDFCFMLVRSQDVATYVYHQAADIGVVGLDVLEEQPYNIMRLLNLNIGKCRVVVGAHAHKPIDYSKPKITIATKMPNITAKYFSQKAIPIDMIKLYGSIELAALVGLCDGIVDIVETGETMRANNLIESEKILDSSAYLIANFNSFSLKKHAILELCSRIEVALEH